MSVLMAAIHNGTADLVAYNNKVPQNMATIQYLRWFSGHWNAVSPLCMWCTLSISIFRRIGEEDVISALISI